MVALPLIALLLAAQAPASPPALPVPITSTVPSCPANPDDITVCGRRNGNDSYRLPQADRFDPAGPTDSVSRERHRMIEVGGAGIGSCTPVGPGGWTGCMLGDWRHADEQYAGRNHSVLPRASVHVGVVGRAQPPQ